MKKIVLRILSLGLASVLALSMTACSGDNNSSASSAAASSSVSSAATNSSASSAAASSSAVESDSSEASAGALPGKFATIEEFVNSDIMQEQIVLLSSKIGPVLANNFPPQLLKNLFSVSEAPALIIKVQYLALMRQPVQQSCCEDSVAKKLRPAIKAFI